MISLIHIKGTNFNFTLAVELFTKVLESLATCLSVNDKLCQKLASPLESPITFDTRFKVTSVPYLLLLLIVYFASSITNTIVAARSRFPVILIYCVASICSIKRLLFT